MIIVSGMNNPIDLTGLSDSEKSIFIQKDKSTVPYRYDSYDDLKFELQTRIQIVQAARALLASKADFATFKKSRCNEKFWTRNEQGGFKLKSDVLPADGIKDIFAHGKLYGFECATAMVIVLYKAVLESIGETKFNSFKDLLLEDWHFSSELRLITQDHTLESYLGDILYFTNPDVSPDTPEWQGENVVKLGGDIYYGHGIGIKSSKEMIAHLNKHRKRGSTKSAYLLDQATFPDFTYLYQISKGRNATTDSLSQWASHPFILAKVGSSTYIRV